MDNSKVKVWNDTKFNIGLKDINRIEYNIRPGSFALLDPDTIAYFVTIARNLFDEPHKLRIENGECATSCGVSVEEENVLDEAYIRKNLNASVNKVRKYVDGITDAYLLDTVCDVAISMDLSNSKMAIFREKCPYKFED